MNIFQSQRRCGLWRPVTLDVALGSKTHFKTVGRIKVCPSEGVRPIKPLKGVYTVATRNSLRTTWTQNPPIRFQYSAECTFCLLKKHRLGWTPNRLQTRLQNPIWDKRTPERRGDWQAENRYKSIEVGKKSVKKPVLKLLNRKYRKWYVKNEFPCMCIP